MTALHVFTRDLRTHDNPGLMAPSPDVVPVFVADPAAERLHGSRNRQAYLDECIVDLAATITELGSSLVYRSGPWVDTVLEVADEAGAHEIHVARDVSALAQRRLERLRASSPIPVVTHDSITVVPPDALAPSTSGDFYQVFTPYYRAWASRDWRPLLSTPETLARHDVESEDLPEPTAGSSPDRQHGGETTARLDMDRWIPKSRRYASGRNDLAADATSKLSSALHFGTISALELALRADEAGGEEYVRQVAWRDFNAQVLLHRPGASTRNYRGPDLAWNDDEDGFEAWKDGRTGYPIVDAGMRQLRATGWMHNRARMIVASFLTKDLMIDWRLGARHFMDWLTDGDVANNQLGWQWVAGTGTDTNPTRIFNPTLQSERYDPTGDYIRRWVPELAGVADDEIHDPGPLTRTAADYPLPIVDHHEAIRDFKEARGFG
jgi:deoxyribodipyrimidine photo-lyase